MATLSGREALITVNSTTEEATVTEMGNWSISIALDEIDTTAFGDGWGKSDVGMKKWSGSISGFYDPTDTTGQGIIEAAMLSGELLQDIRFYAKKTEEVGKDNLFWSPDTSSDPNAGLRVTSYETAIDKSGVASLEISFTGSGPVKSFSEAVVA